MKTVTNIENFISSLKKMEATNGQWKIYPEIAGYSAKAKIVNGTVIIKDKAYDCRNYFLERGLDLKNESVEILVAPKNDSQWIDFENIFTINMQVKNKMDLDLETVLNDCYIFSLEADSEIPTLPYYSSFNTLYELLDNLNFLDRNLRTVDWINLGLTISRGNQKILYIKPPLEAITTIKEISYKVGRTGVIIPIAKFEPVNFNGALTLQATLHNSKILADNRLRVNDIITIKIKRQGHHGTEVTSVLYPFNDSTRIASISKCPSCNSNLVKKKRGEYLICPNSLCREKLIKKILYWCSSDGMNIKGLGIRYIEFLICSGTVTTVDDLYTLEKKDLLNIPGILDKMADNILKEIEASKQKNLIDVFIGLGIDEIGKNASKLLAWYLMGVYNLMLLTPPEVKKLSIFLSQEQRSNLNEYLKNQLNKEMLLNLSRHLKPELPNIKDKDHKYYKKNFVLKGTFPLLGRNKVKNILIRSGAYVMPVDNKQFDYCLYNDNRKVVYKFDKNKTVKISKLLLELIA